MLWHSKTRLRRLTSPIMQNGYGCSYFSSAQHPSVLPRRLATSRGSDPRVCQGFRGASSHAESLLVSRAFQINFPFKVFWKVTDLDGKLSEGTFSEWIRPMPGQDPDFYDPNLAASSEEYVSRTFQSLAEQDSLLPREMVRPVSIYLSTYIWSRCTRHGGMSRFSPRRCVFLDFSPVLACSWSRGSTYVECSMSAIKPSAVSRAPASPASTWWRAGWYARS